MYLCRNCIYIIDVIIVDCKKKEKNNKRREDKRLCCHYRKRFFFFRPRYFLVKYAFFNNYNDLVFCFVSSRIPNAL